VMDFLVYLESERGNSPSARNARLAAVKSFMRFVEYRVPALLEQIRRVRAIPTKKTDQPLIRHLSMTEIQAILNAPDLRTRCGIRDRAMLHVCFAAGLRVSELIGLPLTAVRLQPTPTLHIQGKGRRHRALPLWKQTAEDVRAWLAVRGEVLVPELFVSAQGRAMTRVGFAYILRKYARRAAKDCRSLAGKQVSPHVLRHSCAMLIYQATGDLRKVALWLGHAHMQTTEVYLRADPTEKLNAIEAVVPPSLRRGQFTVPDRLIAALHGQSL
jgi:integrase/recombinase XerD